MHDLLPKLLYQHNCDRKPSRYVWYSRLSCRSGRLQRPYNYVRRLPGFPFLNREEHIRRSCIPDAWFRLRRRLRLCLQPMCKYSRQYTRKPGGLRLYIRNKSVNVCRRYSKWFFQTYEQSFYKLYILLADYSRYKSDNQTNHPDSRLQADR